MVESGDSASIKKPPTKKRSAPPQHNARENANVAAIYQPRQEGRPRLISGGASGAGASGSSAVAGGGLGIQFGGGAGTGITAQPPSDTRPRKRTKKVDPPEGIESVCSVCGKAFASWRSLFGHMRCHPERPWRGCFPPPVAGQQQRPRAGHAYAGDEAAFGGGIRQRERMDIDLNKPQEGDFGVPTSPTKKDVVGDGGGFDLNMPPKPDDEDHASHN